MLSVTLVTVGEVREELVVTVYAVGYYPVQSAEGLEFVLFNCNNINFVFLN